MEAGKSHAIFFCGRLDGSLVCEVKLSDHDEVYSTQQDSKCITKGQRSSGFLHQYLSYII